MRFFDLHCDTMVECCEQQQPLYENTLAVSMAKARCFEESAHCFALWLPDGLDGPSARRKTERLIRSFQEEISLCYPLVRRGSLPLMGKPPQHLAMLTVENGTALGGELSMVGRLRSAGAVMMTLCWNGENSLAGGCESHARLSAFGRDVIREMERVGMLVDVSHLNDASFYEVAACANEPLVASHSNARSVCHHPRNLTDSQLKLIAESGGLIGITLYDGFLRPGGHAGMEDLYRQVDYMLGLGLEDHVAVGTDFDGGPTLGCIPSIDHIPEWADYLINQGIPAAICDKLFYRNAMEFFQRR